MIAAISKVYEEAGEWVFLASVKYSAEEKSKRHSNVEKKDSTKERARLIKGLKSNGFKVLMVQ